MKSGISQARFTYRTTDDAQGKVFLWISGTDSDIVAKALFDKGIKSKSSADSKKSCWKADGTAPIEKGSSEEGRIILTPEDMTMLKNHGGLDKLFKELIEQHTPKPEFAAPAGMSDPLVSAAASATSASKLTQKYLKPEDLIPLISKKGEAKTSFASSSSAAVASPQPDQAQQESIDFKQVILSEVNRQNSPFLDVITYIVEHYQLNLETSQDEGVHNGKVLKFSRVSGKGKKREFSIFFDKEGVVKIFDHKIEDRKSVKNGVMSDSKKAPDELFGKNKFAGTSLDRQEFNEWEKQQRNAAKKSAKSKPAAAQSKTAASSQVFPEAACIAMSQNELVSNLNVQSEKDKSCTAFRGYSSSSDTGRLKALEQLRKSFAEGRLSGKSDLENGFIWDGKSSIFKQSPDPELKSLKESRKIYAATRDGKMLSPEWIADIAKLKDGLPINPPAGLSHKDYIDLLDVAAGSIGTGFKVKPTFDNTKVGLVPTKLEGHLHIAHAHYPNLLDGADLRNYTTSEPFCGSDGKVFITQSSVEAKAGVISDKQGLKKAFATSIVMQLYIAKDATGKSVITAPEVFLRGLRPGWHQGGYRGSNEMLEARMLFLETFAEVMEVASQDSELKNVHVVLLPGFERVSAEEKKNPSISKRYSEALEKIRSLTSPINLFENMDFRYLAEKGFTVPTNAAHKYPMGGHLLSGSSAAEEETVLACPQLAACLSGHSFQEQYDPKWLEENITIVDMTKYHKALMEKSSTVVAFDVDTPPPSLSDSEEELPRKSGEQPNPSPEKPSQLKKEKPKVRE